MYAFLFVVVAQMVQHRSWNPTFQKDIRVRIPVTAFIFLSSNGKDVRLRIWRCRFDSCQEDLWHRSQKAKASGCNPEGESSSLSDASLCRYIKVTGIPPHCLCGMRLIRCPGSIPGVCAIYLHSSIGKSNRFLICRLRVRVPLGILGD